MQKSLVLAIVKVIKVIGDLSFINLGIILAFLARFGGVIPNENWPAYVTTAPWITLLALILLKIYGLYETKTKNWPDVFLSIVCVVFVTFVGIMAISFMFRSFAFPRTVIFITPLMQLLLLSVWRYFFLILVKRIYGFKKVIIIGRFIEAQQMSLKVKQFNEDLKVEGLIVDHNIQISQNCNHSLVLGEYRQFSDIISKITTECILLCPSLSKDEKATFINTALAHDIQVFVVPEIHEILLAQAKINQIGDTPIFELNNFQIDDNYRFIKRIMDIFFSGFGLFLAWPFMVLVALLIKLDSKGPIFYSQDRVSENGSIFKLHKFRTMVQDAEKSSGPVLATKDDPRITKIGRFLRATRIDELPQLINILKGEMSLVGPRPERPYFVDQFNKEFPGYIYRQKVKSGLTGLAQVAGKYSTTPEDKLRYDLLYAKTYSLVNDLKIILQTLKVVLMRDKSA